MKTALIIISSIIAVVNVIPYWRDVIAHRTKPRIVSWFNWSLLTAIASAASFSSHQYASAILALIASLETMSVVILGLKYGDRRIELFDVGCQLGAITGLVLWGVFNSPAVAIIASLTVDFIASLPTLKHAWQKPREETAITYLLGGVAAIFTLMAANNLSIAAVALPIYLVVADFLLAGIIYGRERAV